MQELNNTEQLREWIKECPLISKNNYFRVNYLSGKPNEYAIYSLPSSINYTENVLGENIPALIQTMDFIFASTEYYGSDIQKNLSVLSFFEAIVKWIYVQNKIKNFPKINDGIVKSIIPALTVYPAEVGNNEAKYQIQLKLTYRRY